MRPAGMRRDGLAPRPPLASDVRSTHAMEPAPFPHRLVLPGRLIRHDPVLGHAFVPSVRRRVPHEHGAYFAVTNAAGFREDHELEQPAGHLQQTVVVGARQSGFVGCAREVRPLDPFPGGHRAGIPRPNRTASLAQPRRGMRRARVSASRQQKQSEVGGRDREPDVRPVARQLARGILRVLDAGLGSEAQRVRVDAQLRMHAPPAPVRRFRTGRILSSKNPWHFQITGNAGAGQQ